MPEPFTIKVKMPFKTIKEGPTDVEVPKYVEELTGYRNTKFYGGDYVYQGIRPVTGTVAIWITQDDLAKLTEAGHLDEKSGDVTVVQ